jgi:uncharacterized protein
MSVMIPVRRIMTARAWRVRLWHLGVAGAAVGFLNGLLSSTGPLSVPAFIGIGLSGGAFLGSEAASALLLYTAKLATFGQFGVLTTSLVVRGMVVGAALMIGPFLTRTIVRRLRPHAYTLLIDTVLVAAAAGMFIATRTA